MSPRLTRALLALAVRKITFKSWYTVGFFLLEIRPFSVHGQRKHLKSTQDAINPRVMITTFIIADVK